MGCTQVSGGTEPYRGLLMVLHINWKSISLGYVLRTTRSQTSTLDTITGFQQSYTSAKWTV